MTSYSGGWDRKKQYECVEKWRRNNRYKLNKTNKAYYEKHKAEINIRLKKYGSKYKIGGNRNLVMIRDGNMCVLCSMTNEEHLKKYGVQLNIHHIDGNGTYSKKRNNSICNLVALCSSCHGYIHGKRIENLFIWGF